MPHDILTLSLDASYSSQPPRGLSLRPLDAPDCDTLAALYLESYPPGIGAADFYEAQQEIAATFAGEFGKIRADASASVWNHDVPIGAIMVVEQSIWDEGLEGPFIIDLFVSPPARGCGAGRALITHAIQACTMMGDSAISLRFGQGTSAAAMTIYRQLGFIAPAEVLHVN